MTSLVEPIEGDGNAMQHARGDVKGRHKSRPDAPLQLPERVLESLNTDQRRLEAGVKILGDDLGRGRTDLLFDRLILIQMCEDRLDKGAVLLIMKKIAERLTILIAARDAIDLLEHGFNRVEPFFTGIIFNAEQVHAVIFKALCRKS